MPVCLCVSLSQIDSFLMERNFQRSAIVWGGEGNFLFSFAYFVSGWFGDDVAVFAKGAINIADHNNNPQYITHHTENKIGKKSFLFFHIPAKRIGFCSVRLNSIKTISIINVTTMQIEFFLLLNILGGPAENAIKKYKIKH